MAKRLLIIDGSNYMYRGHFALPNLKSPDGHPTGAVKGMTEMIFADMRVLDPDYVAVVFDLKGKTFRHEIYPEYKANRGTNQQSRDLAETVYSQKPIIRRVLKSLGFAIVQKTGIEGDDIMGALAHQHCSEMPVYIGTNDKDLYQMVQKNVSIFTKDRIPHGYKQTVEKFGVRPDQIVDYLMMVGDTADNIPGVHKCGPKTAAKMLVEHNDLQTIRKAKPFTPALAANFKERLPFFKLSRQLFTIDVDCIKPVGQKRLRIQEPDWDEFSEICKEFGLKALYRSANEFFKNGGATTRNGRASTNRNRDIPRSRGLL